jgi:hypothetical protein
VSARPNGNLGGAGGIACVRMSKLTSGIQDRR